MTPALSPLHEIVADEIHGFVERERKGAPALTREMLMLTLANRLGLAGVRQLYRYMSGETPFPLSKTAAFCRTVGSYRLLEAANQDAGLVAEPIPEPERLEPFDLLDEEARQMREAGEFIATFAEEVKKSPREMDLARIEKEGREVIQQTYRVLAWTRQYARYRFGRV